MKKSIITEVPRPTCGTCPYWLRSKVTKGTDIDLGWCRRNANMWQSNRQYMEFCGEHPEFPVYLRFLRVAGPKCETCTHLTGWRETDKSTFGTCKLLDDRFKVVYDHACYRYERKKEPKCPPKKNPK